MTPTESSPQVPADLPERLWQLAGAARHLDLPGCFQAEPDRVARLSRTVGPIHADVSKQLLPPGAIDTLMALARGLDTDGFRRRLATGGIVNPTEFQPASHMALRGTGPGADEAGAQTARMLAFATAVRQGAATGADGGRFTQVLHLGVGGSGLGPELIADGLGADDDTAPGLICVGNIDGHGLDRALAVCDPRRTLVVTASKSFTTEETTANHQACAGWLRAALGAEALATHLAAATSRPDRARAAGIDEARIFPFDGAVGGRFSLWSPVSLAAAIRIGPARFEELLSGARALDRHFLDTPLEDCLPVLLALVSVWNTVYLGLGGRAVIPYDQRLRRLPAYLQQLEMESNGKRIRLDGQPVIGPTAPLVLGEVGTTAQHAVFQHLHQSNTRTPVDFLLIATPDHGWAEHHDRLLANGLAQAAALMAGRTEAEAVARMAADGLEPDRIAALGPHRAFPGSRPSTTVILDRLTPDALGAYLALEEHRVAVAGWLMRINSFDQWGVELGKQLSGPIRATLADSGDTSALDPSTAALIGRLRALR